MTALDIFEPSGADGCVERQRGGRLSGGDGWLDGSSSGERRLTLGPRRGDRQGHVASVSKRRPRAWSARLRQFECPPRALESNKPTTMAFNINVENTEGHSAADPGRRDPRLDIRDAHLDFELTATTAENHVDTPAEG
jgi:hypothetical protein